MKTAIIPAAFAALLFGSAAFALETGAGEYGDKAKADMEADAKVDRKFTEIDQNEDDALNQEELVAFLTTEKKQTREEATATFADVAGDDASVDKKEFRTAWAEWEKATDDGMDGSTR
ncbi:MAG: hypothetical protein GC152_06245 [Alphaproteobacteria bacterium]|nr:hypothetical protein [Alphaproteobacteria bacterium]